MDKKYRQNPPTENKLMTQAVRIGLNGKKHRRNLNTLVCGGSGAGKTRFYCKPNLMQANTSFVILDPNGYTPIQVLSLVYGFRLSYYLLTILPYLTVSFILNL